MTHTWFLPGSVASLLLVALVSSGCMLKLRTKGFSSSSESDPKAERAPKETNTRSSRHRHTSTRSKKEVLPTMKRVAGFTAKPLYDQGDRRGDDALRSATFMSAPRDLFVYANRDMTKKDGEVLELRVSFIWHSKSPPHDLPKRNEPLLIVNDGMRNGSVVVLAADGSMFLVKNKSVSLHPSGPIVLPKRARNPQMTWSAAVHGRTAEDGANHAVYQKEVDRYERCAEPIRRTARQRIQRLEEAPAALRQPKLIDRIGYEARQDEQHRCKVLALDAATGKYWLQLMASRLESRDARLSKIRAKLKKRFR